MHKLEIHTTEEGLSRLNLINQEHLAIAGYHHVDARILNNSRLSSEIKIEAFMSHLPEDLLALLDSDDLIHQYNLTECSQTYLLDPLATAVDSSTSNNVAVPQDGQSAPHHPDVTGDDITIEIKELPTGKLKMTVKSYSTTFFLSKIVGILANSGIAFEKAQTFPQSQAITGTVVIPRLNSEQLSHIQDEIRQQLSSNSMGNCGYKKFSRAAISPTELKITLDLSGSMAALRVKCDKNDILTRFTILEAISLYDLEITISRLGGLGKKLEDVYYVKNIGSIAVSDDLINQITNHITGTNS